MSGYQGPIVDVDIHHRPAFDRDFLDYFPERSRAYAEAAVRAKIPFRVGRGVIGLADQAGRRADAFPEDGGAPGSSYELLRRHILDEYGIFRGLLTHDVGEYASHLNHYFAADLCRAANDWNIDRWLSHDERLYSGILAAPSLQDEAVAEIRRLADHPRMAYVALAGNPLQRPLGDPLYHPIYEAAAEVGLPVGIHVASTEFPTIEGPAGTKATLIENLSNMGAQAGHYVASLITHGVFEKFRDLQFLFIEYGLSWLPPVVWSLERDYDLLRLESPWVKKRPTEYVHDHIRLSTQPLEAGRPEEARRLIQLLEGVDGIEDVLCFSTDYPHYSMDDYAFIARSLPASWHSKVFCENACAFFGWTPPVDTTSAPEVSVGV